MKPWETPETAGTLLVDADILCFQAAAAADGRCYTTPDGTEFKYKKEAVAYNGGSSVGITLEFKPEPVSHALHTLKLSLNGLDERYPGHTKNLYLTGKTNFRKSVYEEYKANRKETRVPEHLGACKKFLVDKHGAVVSENCEADDLIAIESNNLGDTACIVCTLDKDMDMIPGVHWNWRKQEEYIVHPEEGMRAFYRQLLMGDKTDNIPGIQGIGPKKAEKIIHEAMTDPAEMYQAALFAHRGHHTELEVTRNAQLLWLQREVGEVWSPPVEVR